MAFSHPQNQPHLLQMCCIALSSTDLIRLIGVPEELIPGLRQAILTCWTKQIQHESSYHGAYQFKLKGNPWVSSSQDTVEAIHAHELLIGVLVYMARSGFHLVQRADISKVQGDLDTLFFESGERDSDTEMFAVNFSSSDKIRVIGAPSIMIPMLKAAVDTHWPQGIQKDKEKHGVPELTLIGDPWYNRNGPNEIKSRVMLMNILAQFRTAGFKLYTSVDIFQSQKNHCIDSWVFRKVGVAWQ